MVIALLQSSVQTLRNVNKIESIAVCTSYLSPSLSLSLSHLCVVVKICVKSRVITVRENTLQKYYVGLQSCYMESGTWKDCHIQCLLVSFIDLVVTEIILFFLLFFCSFHFFSCRFPCVKQSSCFEAQIHISPENDSTLSCRLCHAVRGLRLQSLPVDR